jgi:rSAM/selenodomain-associated transferase 1
MTRSEIGVDDNRNAIDRRERCAIAIMAKAPSAGRVKTRLSPFLTPEEARDIGCCFLTDMTGNLALAAREVALDPYIAFAPAGSEAAFAPIVHGDTRFVLADGSAPAAAGVTGFGCCLLQAARSLFALGYGAVGLLNSDSPTLPTSLLVKAFRLLSTLDGAAVLGPSPDGGYYLLGMKTLQPHLFAAIDWSTERVARQTRLRAREAGLHLVELDPWYDVDDAASLRRLCHDIDGLSASRYVPFPAPATTAWLRRNHIDRRFASHDDSAAGAVRAAAHPR